MTDTEDKIIQDLIAKNEVQSKQLAELHDKFASKRNWFSKEMIGVYSAMIAGVVAWGNNQLADTQREEDVAKRNVTSATLDAGTFQYVDDTADAIYETCNLYFEAVTAALPAYQQRKVERFLETEGALPRVPKAEEAEADTLDRAGVDVGDEVELEMAPPPPESAPYQQLIRASKDPVALLQELEQRVRQNAIKGRKRLAK